MNSFYSLSIDKIEKNTAQSVVLTLGCEEKLAKKFSFRAGQYLTVRHHSEGEDLRRCYSICSVEGGSSLQIGIKKVEGGAFSSFANEILKVGDRLEVMPPSGKFTLMSTCVPRHVLAVAAGSGITPIISHIERILLEEESSNITLIYSNKTPSSIMFRERIEDLKNLYLERFSVIHVLSSTPQDIELFSGRIDAAKLQKIITSWGQTRVIDNVLLCGPEDMVQSLRDEFFELGVPYEKILYELFSTEKRKNIKPVNQKVTTLNEVEVTIILDGVTHKLEMSGGGTILSTALENSLDAPFSCQGGICSSCRCKIIEGSGEMEVNHALEDYEVRDGYALSCQLRSTTKKITVTYDEGH